MEVPRVKQMNRLGCHTVTLSITSGLQVGSVESRKSQYIDTLTSGNLRLTRYLDKTESAYMVVTTDLVGDLEEPQTPPALHFLPTKVLKASLVTGPLWCL